MIRPTLSIALTRSKRCRAFTALEALVMLVTLFILTMLLIGLWLKKGKEDNEIEMPTPANTTEPVKSEPPQPDKAPTAEKSEQQPTPEKPELK